MTFLETGLMGTILILVICALRAAALNRLPRRTFVILWVLAALRLLIPVQISSPMSVYRLLDAAPEEVTQLGAADQVMTAHSANAAAGPGSAAEAALIETSTVLPADTVSGWAVAWWTGAAVFGAVALVLYSRLLRRFAQSYPVDTPAVRSFSENHPLRRRLQIRCSEKISAPLTYGIVRPVILLPSSMDLSDTKKLDYVLTHEYVHVRHFDILSKLLLTAACCCHWWNPFVWILYILANRDIELACDESVVTRCGSPASYARVLLQLEEQKIAPMMPAMAGGAHAAKERIQSIMKLKKKSVLTLAAAGVLIAGVGTAFATSAPPSADPVQGQTAIYDEVVMEGTATEDAPAVEWWTADEFEEWLENEKIELAKILGEKGWTPSEGEFIWTQERIDEAIARYEEMLREIRAGARISKTVDGADDIMLIQSAASEDVPGSCDTALSEAQIKEYAPFGLAEGPDGTLTYNGETVRFFEDSVELAEGEVASKSVYFSDEGTACVRTVRRAAPNGDGSVDPFGELLGIEPIPEAEAERLIAGLTDASSGTTVVAEDVVTDADLEPYTPFGLSYEILPDGIRMEYDGRPVHSLYDPATGTWIANNQHGYALGADRIDLEAVYQDGHLCGLKEVPEYHTQETVVTYEVTPQAAGRTFDDVFAAYTSLGLRFETVSTPAGGTAYNLYFGDRLINRFAAIEPNGGAFSYESADQSADGINVRVVYDGETPVRLVQDSGAG